jgi:hypothetical protein
MNRTVLKTENNGVTAKSIQAMKSSNTTFKKGAKPGPGRPKGLPNKIPASIKQGFLETFQELQKDPEKNLTAWAKKNTNLFYTLATKLIPTEIKAGFGGKTIVEIIRRSAAPETNAQD